MEEQLVLEAGKIRSGVFERAIFPRLGAVRPDVIVGPRHGVDVAILDVGAGRVMALSTDPLFVVPEYGWERAGWFAVQIVMSDVATSGLTPSHMTIDLNLPPLISDADLEALWSAIHDACAAIGVAVVAGHTGRYEGCSFPTIGGATGMAIGDREAYVTPAMARPGDALLVTKGPAIETTALFGVSAGDTIARSLGEDIARAASALFDSLTVIPDAAIAATAGVREEGVTGMHDATERGVLGGLIEMAEASGSGILVDVDAMPPRPEVAAVCSLFDIDPYTTSSEGTLLISCRAHRAPEVVDRLRSSGIDTFVVGQMLEADAGMRVVRDGREVPLLPPATDPFWPAYRRFVEAEPA